MLTNLFAAKPGFWDWFRKRHRILSFIKGNGRVQCLFPITRTSSLLLVEGRNMESRVGDIQQYRCTADRLPLVGAIVLMFFKEKTAETKLNAPSNDGWVKIDERNDLVLLCCHSSNSPPA
jgi:hypothetical protein